ncbi:unnamed protein product [Trichobilharzia regenti]|nr:unnamed protein product [Trichobilharzia regenti]
MSLSWFESISRRRRACGKRKSNELISDKKQKNSRCASSSEEAANSRIIQCNKSINPPTLTLNENVLKAYVVEETEMLAFFKLLDLKEIVPNQAIFTPDITPNSNDSAFHSLLEGSGMNQVVFIVAAPLVWNARLF